MIWPDPTHQPNPPNYAPRRGWRSLHRFQIFKKNWNISISSSAIEFWLIRDGWVWVEGGERVPPTHMHTQAHAHTCAYDIIGNSQRFPQWGQPFAWNYYVYHACMCVHACECMCMCVGCTPHPHPPTPHPQSHRELKTPKFNNSWTNQDNLILFEDSLPLNIPELI